MAQISWGVFGVCIVWLALMISLKNPAFFQNLYLSLPDTNPSYAQELDKLKGVIEWYVSGETLVVKFDAKVVGREKLTNMLKS
jgi:hypothetical protein